MRPLLPENRKIFPTNKKSVILYLHNLQQQNKKCKNNFSLLKCAKYLQLNSARLIGPDYASLVYTMMPEPTYCSSTQRLSSSKRLQRTSLLQATSMCNLSTNTGCNESQQPSKRLPLTSMLQYNKPENGISFHKLKISHKSSTYYNLIVKLLINCTIKKKYISKKIFI